MPLRPGNRQRASRLELIAVPAILVGLACAGCRAAPTPAAGPLWIAPDPATPVAATVTFTGTQLVIENRSPWVWRDVAVSVGRLGDAPAYTYRADAILGGRTLVMGVLNFARPDDTRLNPFRVRPTRWAVRVALGGGRVGFAEGSFE